MTRACTRCGITVDVEGEDEAPAGWSFEFTERGLTWQCGECIRTNIRSIEAKLPEEYW